MSFSHEAVDDVIRIEVKSSYRSVRRDAIDVGTLEGTSACAGNLELNDRAVPIAHETVIHI